MVKLLFSPSKDQKAGKEQRILKGQKEDGSKNEKLWEEQEIAGREGGWALDREGEDAETEVRPALQAGGRQSTSLSAYKTRGTQQASSSPGIRALWVGTRPLDSNKLCFEEQKARWTLCY